MSAGGDGGAPAEPRLKIDVKQVVRAIVAVFCRCDQTGYLNLRVNEQGKGNRSVRRAPIMVRLDDAAAIGKTFGGAAKLAANNPVPTFLAVPHATFRTPDNAKTINCKEAATLVADLDTGEPLAKVAKAETLLGPPTLVSETGGTTDQGFAKLQVVWRLKVPALAGDGGHKKLADARARLAEYLDSDRAAKSVVQPFRWPGSWHRKNDLDPKMTTIVGGDEDAEIDLDTARAALPPLAGKGAKKKAKAKPQASPDRLQSALDAIDNDGEGLHYDTWFKVLCGIHHESRGSDEGYEIAHAFSARSDKFDEATTRKKWGTIDPDHPNPVTAGTIFKIAREDYGWVDAGSQAALVEEFNAKYFVVNEAGKAVVYAPKHDPVLNRRFYERITFAALVELYLNRVIQSGTYANGAPKFTTVADVWLRHRHRKQYIGGIVFDPSGREQPGDVFNLWSGFAVEPKPGKWGKLREHVRGVICGGDDALFTWLMDWLADLVQNPGKQGEVAIVLSGGEGVGKGILARAVKFLFGQHGFAISNPKHLIGNFNAHLRDCVFLFADEAFYAGDKAHTGILKSIITEPYLTVEGKFQTTVMAPNYLHLMLASNEQWVVPAALDSRRFAVFGVSDEHANDQAYFGAIQHELDHGGHEAMLHELRHRKITSNLRRAPVTDALVEQRKLSLPTSESWWLDCLHRGYVLTSRHGQEEYFAQWYDVIATEVLFASYLDYARSRNRYDRHPLSREGLAKWLRTMGCEQVRRRGEVVVGERRDYLGFGHIIKRDRARCYACGSLERARAWFSTTTGLPIDWEAELPDHDDEDSADPPDEGGKPSALDNWGRAMGRVVQLPTKKPKY